MKIWANSLVKNEARWLWFSITSIIDYVDKILLWDTGSTDGTLQIIEALKSRYPDKIIFKNVGGVFSEQNSRQAMLEETQADWFIVLDGDEVWWKDSITRVVEEINKIDVKQYEGIVVPTVNLIGDIFHYQEGKAGKYSFGNKRGHYALKAVSTHIEGLHSEGEHWGWGWVDREGKKIQERDGGKKIKYVESPYLHATHLIRSLENDSSTKTFKRKAKYKHELGNRFPLDYYYPEAFFKARPSMVPSPWNTMDLGYKVRAAVETPVKKIKRRVIK